MDIKELKKQYNDLFTYVEQQLFKLLEGTSLMNPVSCNIEIPIPEISDNELTPVIISAYADDKIWVMWKKVEYDYFDIDGMPLGQRIEFLEGLLNTIKQHGKKKRSENRSLDRGRR